MMTERLRQLGAQIDAMELRQRIMLLGASLCLLFFVADSLAIQPAIKQQKMTRHTITDWELRLDVLRQRSGILPGQADTGVSSQRNNLLTQLEFVESRLREQMGGMLAPEQAIKVLEQVLEQEQGLQLRKVTASKLPLNSEERLDEEDRANSGIGRYQMQLQLEGSYLATLHYMRALENLPWNFFWEAVDYQVTSHPSALITLDIYTLGLLGDNS